MCGPGAYRPDPTEGLPVPADLPPHRCSSSTEDAQLVPTFGKTDQEESVTRGMANAGASRAG